jgi:hypothetical protein
MTVMGYTPLPEGSPIEPDPWIEGNLTKDSHKSAWATFTYEDDLGAEKSISSFAVSSNVNQPYQVNYTKIYAPGVLQEVSMPNEKTACKSDKWNETACWTETETGSGTGTVSNATVDGYGKALSFKHVGNAASVSDTKWVYDLTDITTDIEKTRFIVGIRILQMGSNTEGYITITDGTDDSGYDFRLAAGSNDGYETLGSKVGDSRFNDVLVNELGETPNTLTQIKEISVNLQDDNAGSSGTIEFQLLAMATGTKRMMVGYDQSGEKVYNQTFTNGLDYVNITTFSPSFTYNRVGDLKIAFQQKASTLSSDSVSVSDKSISSGSYEREITYRFDYYLPKAVDLTYANLKLFDKLRVDGDQFDEVLVGTDDKTSLYNAAVREVGDKITLKSTSISEDNTYTVKMVVKYTGSQWEKISQAPGLLTTAGIWYQILGGVVLILSLVSVGAAATYRRRMREMRNRPSGK